MKKLIPYISASFCSLSLISCQNTPTIVPDVAPVKTVEKKQEQVEKSVDKTKSKVKVKAKKNHPHMLVPPC